MKRTNFNRFRHGAVTYLTWDKLKAVVERHKVDIELD
jgi:hypothetical protein